MKRISKFIGVVLTLSLLTSLAIVAAPASAGTLSWTAETGFPSTAATVNTVIAGADVTKVAVAADNSIVWIVDTTSNRTLTSTNGGNTWSRKTHGLAGNVTLVAIAPDDANIVAVVDNLENVRVTTNGGTTFSTLTGHGFANINAVAISPITSGAHYITIAGDIGGAAAVSYFNLGASVPTWTNIANWAGLDADQDVNALAYSPAFASDRILVAIGENSSGSVLYEIASFASQQWNDSAGFTNYDGTNNIIGAIAPPLDGASLVLYPTYLGADDAERRAFVGLDGPGATGGIFRMADNADTAIGPANAQIYSVDYDGTNLVAGDSAANIVYRSSNPLAGVPTVSTTSVYQRPGGTNMVSVAWVGETVLAGTQGNESAVALSSDSGATFNDVSYIDTALTNIADLTLNADGSVIFMVTNDGADTSVFKKSGGSWARLLNLKTITTTNILRLAPGSTDTIYLGDTTSTTLYYSNDGGETKWQLRALNAAPADIAVESADVAYALQGNGAVSKTTNAGFIWGAGKATGLTGGSELKSLGPDALIAGGTAGDYAWSADGNSTWTRKTGSAGTVHVAASGVADGDYVYVASETGNQSLKRWTIGTSTTASTMSTADTNNYGTQGLLLGEGGVLYAVGTNGTDSQMRRFLTPNTAGSTTAGDVVASAGEVFNLTVQGAKLTTGSNKVWAPNNIATDNVYTFTDDVFTVGVSLSGPANGITSNVNPVTGRAADVIFTWSRLSQSTAYSLEIAYDSGFAEDVTTIAVASGAPTLVTQVGPFQAGANQVELQPGTMYYWRVRATAPLTSPWSETRSFTVASVETPFSISGPAAGSMDVSTTPLLTWDSFEGATGYELALSEDPSFQIVDWVRNVTNNFYSIDDALREGTTYYWRVRAVTGSGAGDRGPWVTGVFSTMTTPEPEEPTVITITEQAPTPPVQIVEIPVTETRVVQQAIPDALLWTIIVIGAVLIVALIVLIVRTRRA